MYNEVGKGIGDGVLRPNGLDERITNLENAIKIKSLWEDITGSTTGQITLYQRQYPNETQIIPINEDKFFDGEDAIAVKIEDSSPVDKPIFDANGKFILADIDSNGNYILHIGYDEFDDPIPPATPISGNYALIWQIKGQSRDTFVIPSTKITKIVSEYDVDPPFVKNDAISEIFPRNEDYILNLFKTWWVER